MMRQLLKIVQSMRRIYWRLARPETRGVRAILVDVRGKILLVRHKYQEGWFLPGGKVSGREDDQEALRRELQEELGVQTVSRPEKLSEYVNTYEYKKDTIAVFVVREFTQASKRNFEVEEYQFFDPQNLPDGISPGTRRRIEEWLGQKVIEKQW